MGGYTAFLVPSNDSGIVHEYRLIILGADLRLEAIKHSSLNSVVGSHFPFSFVRVCVSVTKALLHPTCHRERFVVVCEYAHLRSSQQMRQWRTFRQFV